MAFMAAALPALSLIGTAVGAAGTLYSGFYQGQVAENNKAIALEKATYARQAGNQNAAVASLKGAAEGAEIKVAQAANGVDVNTGSAKSVQVSHRIASELDVDTIQHNAELEAWGYTTQGEQFGNEATAARVGGVIGAAGDLLTGAKAVDWDGFGGSSWTRARGRVGITG